MINEQLFYLCTQDNINIALWKISDNKKSLNRHIFLTHGTFSNKKICQGISRNFATLGYTCWIMEWRNHGDSQKTHHVFNFETISRYDIATVFDYLFNVEKITSLDCITHSGGGICLTLFLLNNRDYISRLNSITFFSCQAFAAAHTFSNYIRILFSKIVSYILGYTPGRSIGLGHENEAYATMKQWFNWNLKKQFTGNNHVNYAGIMNMVTTPVLSICAGGDTFIAPKYGCEKFLDAFKNPHNKLMYCSRKTGFSNEFNHGSIISSKSSRREIWPYVAEWIEQHHQ